MTPYSKRDFGDCFTHREEEQEPDVFEFQQQDFPDNGNLASIWKSRPEAKYSRNIWQIQMEQSKGDPWPDLSDVESGGGSKWLEQERGKASTGWSCEGQFQPPEPSRTKKSEAVVIPSSIASLWHHSSSPASPTIPSSVPNLQSLWSSCTPCGAEDSEPDTATTKMYIITNPTTHIPGKYNDDCHMASALTVTRPWKHINRMDKAANLATRKGQIWAENSLLGSQQNIDDDDMQKR